MKNADWAYDIDVALEEGSKKTSFYGFRFENDPTTTPEGEVFDPLDHDARWNPYPKKEKKNANNNYYQVSFPNKIKRILLMQKFICILFHFSVAN